MAAGPSGLIPKLHHHIHQLGNDWTKSKNNTTPFPLLSLTPGALLGCIMLWDSSSWVRHLASKRNSVLNACVSAGWCWLWMSNNCFAIYTVTQNLHCIPNLGNKKHFKMLWHLLYLRSEICVLLALSNCKMQLWNTWQFANSYYCVRL